MHRRTRTKIRRAHQHQTRPPARPSGSSGRYLDLRERLQIADLLRLGFSMRGVAEELGRHTSTIKRELDPHRDLGGRYLPRTADHDARLQRARPRATKLVANVALRRLVQGKLNRELLLRDNTGLHKKYRHKLRTGRRIRKSRWLTRTGHGPTATDKTIIDKRPASAESKLEAGHWEGDLVRHETAHAATGRWSRWTPAAPADRETRPSTGRRSACAVVAR